MTDYATVVESKGVFYIAPLQVQLNGASWKTRSDAEYICRAVNAAYARGREDIQRGLRELLNVKGGDENDY